MLKPPLFAKVIRPPSARPPLLHQASTVYSATLLYYRREDRYYFFFRDAGGVGLLHPVNAPPSLRDFYTYKYVRIRNIVSTINLFF